MYKIDYQKTRHQEWKTLNGESKTTWLSLQDAIIICNALSEVVYHAQVRNEKTGYVEYDGWS